MGVRWHPGRRLAVGASGGRRSSTARATAGASPGTWAGRSARTSPLNWAASGINEYVRNANFNQISPRSWWTNLEHGLTYDDNEFKTNQYLHPWNGANYFNTARSNGFGYWASSLFALGGAFFWECCGETHPMSFNDLVSTGIGGMAVGEEMYRVTSQLLDNEDTGIARFLREAGGFVVDPVRGFNRMVSGRASGTHANPDEPLDCRGPQARFFVMTGARIIGRGRVDHREHEHLRPHRHQPQLRQRLRQLAAQALRLAHRRLPVQPGDKQFRTVLRIRGDLYSKAFGGKPDDPSYAWAIVQHFDYHNNQAYEFGQQAFGPSLFARYQLSDTWGLCLALGRLGLGPGRGQLGVSPFLADVADPERYREYDYGPGLGTGLEVT